MTEPWINPLYACEGKQQFEHKRHAVAAAKRRGRRQAYRCQHCKTWHVGTAKRGQKKGKPIERI